MKSKIPAVLCLLVLLAVSCGGTTPSSGKPVNDPAAPYDASVVPEKGQPAFPKLGTTWVVDPDNACRFSDETIRFANDLFEGLKRDHIAEVAVVCQKGVKDNGPYDNGKIWAMQWGNYARLGDKKDRRGLVFLIIPDAPVGRDIVIVERSVWNYTYTALDYWDTMESAAGYARYGQFNEALELLAREADEKLREVVKP
ncbi:MAG: TPM domain-containing protein [Patescibacteria group bacterium]